jgi:chromate transport protein ChrA
MAGAMIGTTTAPGAARGWGLALRKFLLIGLTSFGSGRQAYLYEAFVRSGWIPQDLFLADYAKTMVLPGATFVNLTFLCGLRIAGLPMALVGTALVFLPGTVAIVSASLFLSNGDPAVASILHGILVGAVALLISTIVRIARGAITSLSSGILAVGSLVLMIAELPLIVTVLIIGLLGLWWYRPARRSG